MKFLSLLSLLFSVNLYASTCESLLLEKIAQDPDLRIVKNLNSYKCNENACAVTFEHDSSPFPNLEVLAFLDTKNKIQVNWVPLNNGIGWQQMNRKVRSYVEVQTQKDALVIKASLETPRDSIFWPRHKVYFQETLNCK